MNLGLYVLAIALLVGIVLTVVVYSLFFYHVTRKQPPESNEEALP